MGKKRAEGKEVLSNDLGLRRVKVAEKGRRFGQKEDPKAVFSSECDEDVAKSSMNVERREADLSSRRTRRKQNDCTSFISVVARRF